MLNSVAIIPDGNRRYAKLHNLPVREVYSKSTDKMLNLIKWCKEQNIKSLTLWGFSSENWKRSKSEVVLLLKLFEEKASEIINNEDILKEGVRIRIIGNIEEMPKGLQKLARDIEEKTKGKKKMTVNLLINYGGREEIIQAVNKILSEKKKISGIEEFKKYLWFNEEPDLIIRTSGEMRLSGLLPFQSTYSELYFTKKYFPEFTKRDFLKAVEEFNRRKRRFGK